MSHHPRVAVVILNYNGLRWLRECLSSVFMTDYPNYEVYLVDNGSTDGSVAYVERNFPRARIIENGRNLGFALAYNDAIKRIQADYVLLLNNDTRVLAPEWLNELVRTAHRDTNIIAVACKMVSMADSSVLDSVGGMGIPYWRGFVDIGRDMVDSSQFDHSDFQPFAFCGGAALLNRNAFIRVGGFDPKFHLYVEDADLSWRVRLLGYSISYSPKAKVAHYFSGSAEGRDIGPAKLYYCQRNLLRTILKNCGEATLTWAVSNYFLFSLFAILGFGIFEPEKASPIMKAIIWNLLNLGDTYAERRRIQETRKIGDAQILRRMYPPIERKQPTEHPRLLRMINIIFEISQRKRVKALQDKELGGRQA
jgi:GT2 family glycosyltransferase